MRAFIDLDGTLLDLWPRYYRVFCELLHTDDITLERYKEKKRELGQDSAVAAAFGYALAPDHFIRKAELLEDKSYLSLDELYLSQQQIKTLFARGDAMILTKRRQPDNLEWQLDRLGIRVPVTIVRDQTKLQWIKENQPDEEAVMVGDSMIDIETGRSSNILVLMTGYGLGTKKQFDSIGIPYTYADTPVSMVEYLSTYLKMDL